MKERIIELRKAMKLTQTDLGKAIGLTASGISDVENGRRDVQERHIKLILSAFPRVSETWLRTGVGEMFTSSTEVDQLIAKYSFNDICEEMVRTFASLPAEDQEIVLNYTRRLVANLVADRKAAAADPGQDDDIEAEVEAYRRELEAEKSARIASASDVGKKHAV